MPVPEPILEQHRLAVGQAHDVFHVVVDRLNEAGAALRIFVLGGGAFGLAGLAIVKPVAAARNFCRRRIGDTARR